MSENRDSETGQFTSEQPLFGREGVEAEFGYKRMPEDKPSPQAELDIHAAVEEIRASRDPAADAIDVIQYQRLENGEKAPENETVSLEKAADDLTAYHNQTAVERAKSISADFARAIDEMRGDALKANPKAADELGLSREEVDAAKAAKAEKLAQAEPASEAAETKASSSEPDAYDSIEGLEPELKEVLRKSPQARQFFESYAAEGEQAKQVYAAGLNDAHQFGQGALLALAPELAQVPIEHWGEGITILTQSDPARGQQLATMFSNVAAISQRQQLITQHEQQVAHQNFEALRQQYSRQSDEALGPMTNAEKTAMVEELVDYVGNLGITREQLAQEARTNLALHHPAFQRMAADAIRYQRLKNGAKSFPTRQVPPVSRPGNGGNRPSADMSKIQSLQEQLKTATGNRAVKLGAQLTAEMRRAANR